jgi:2-keto-4-pentenoate hydratase
MLASEQERLSHGARGRPERIPALPPELAAPQRALLERWRQDIASGASRIGWKIGHDIPEVEAVVGRQPVIGCLTSRTLVENGGAWYRRGADLRAETEFAVELGTRLGSGADLSAASASISGLCVAVEIVDLAYAPGDVDAIMRGNVFHRAVAFGPTRRNRRSQLGPATLNLDGTIHHAREPMPDPTRVVQTVAEILGQFGESLVAGDRILSGSFVHEPLGDTRVATATIENLGPVSLSIYDGP